MNAKVFAFKNKQFCFSNNFKLKILIVTAVFSPEPVVSAKLSEDLAHELSKTNTVTVISPKPTRPFGFKLNEKDINKSYTLINLDSYTCPESNVYGRFKESYSFGLACSKYIKENRDNNDWKNN